MENFRQCVNNIGTQQRLERMEKNTHTHRTKKNEKIAKILDRINEWKGGGDEDEDKMKNIRTDKQAIQKFGMRFWVMWNLFDNDTKHSVGFPHQWKQRRPFAMKR